jgi:hypothetical protein
MRLLRLPLFLLLIVAPVLTVLTAAERSAATMSVAATRWLTSLSPEQRQKATFGFDAAERSHWGFVPTEMFPRNGLTIKDMTEPQRKLAHDLLKAGLSQRGYLTVTTIMDLENILKVIEGDRFVRDQERYFFSVFGSPADKGTWGWRVEGHHVSLNFTVVNGMLGASTPTFFGSNPADVKPQQRTGVSGGPPAGTRVLGAQEDAARALLNALDAAARVKATFNAVAPGDILTMNQDAIKPLEAAGITAKDLNANQQKMLRAVIESYSSLMAEDIAAERMARIEKAGFSNVRFAWAGDGERGKKHYFRVQGPTFLIEFDNTQNDGNHVHSVWRDFDGDFGRDLLREHIRSAH